MLRRPQWLRILKRSKKVFVMEHNTNSLPSNAKRCFLIGLGIGTGIAVSAYVVKKISEQNNSRELVLALNQVTSEIKELRVSMIQHFERTASAFSNDQVLTSSKRRFRRVDIKQEVAAESQALRQDESSSEDDFFDLLDEDEQVIFDNESLQDKSILDVDELIKKCDELSENGTDSNKEITILEDLLTRNSDNVEVLWRCARAYKAKADTFSACENFQARKEAIFKGMEYIDKAVDIAENHDRSQKWCAILLGIAAEVAPLQEQISLAHRYRKHITKAIELNPKDSTNYFLMGRWCFEVAGMSWWQRQAAAAFIAEPPTSSFEEALSYFEQAEKLSPGFFKSNSLYIGKCNQSLGDTEKAKEWIRKSLELPVKDYDDQKAEDEATAILQSL